MSYPKPNQGSTVGDPSEIECPACGRANDITGDPIDVGDEFDCAFCDATAEITSVDCSVTVYARALRASHGDTERG